MGYAHTATILAPSSLAVASALIILYNTDHGKLSSPARSPSMVRRAVLLLSLSTTLAVRRLDLTATEGETAGKHAFNGGEEEATCKACKAVMQHVSRRLAEPMYDEQGYFAGRKTRVAGSRKEQAEKLNLAARIEAVLDPVTCRKEMDKHDLAYIAGENIFHYKDPEKPANYPVHMELNDWAKNELGTFCESLFEEKEEELTKAVHAAEEAGARSLDEGHFCKEELDLCRPPPPPAPEPPPPKLSKAERLEKARAVFDSLDANSDGVVDRREIQTSTKNAQREGKLPAGRKVKDEVDAFFRSADDDGDSKVTFDEYKQLWVKSKKSSTKRAEAEKNADVGGEWSVSYFLGEIKSATQKLNKLIVKARAYAKESPYVALAGIGVTTAVVYVGGQVVRVW